MRSLLQKTYDNGLAPTEFEHLLGDYKNLHEHHHKRNDVSIHRKKLIGKLDGIKILIITEPWCSDSLAIVPTLFKLLDDMDGVEIRIALRDENMELMNNYLTNGGAAIPKIIVVNSQYDELFSWGPRPKAAQDIYEQHRHAINDGTIEKIEVTKKIRAFYARDRGQTILDEFINLLHSGLSRKFDK